MNKKSFFGLFHFFLELLFLCSLYTSCFSIGCLTDPVEGSCILCQHLYYDKNFLTDQRLSLFIDEKNCVSKIIIQVYVAKILIFDSSPLLEKYDPNIFNKSYNCIEEAFEKESQIATTYLFSDITFYLSGKYFVLRKNFRYSNQEFFRRSFVNISIISLNEDQPSIIYLKTNEFFIFISGFCLVKNIIFDGSDILAQNENLFDECYNDINIKCCNEKDLIQNSSNACYLKKKIFEKNSLNTFGLFNLEFIFDYENNNIPKIFILNCTFVNFYPLKNVGFTSLIYFCSISGIILIEFSKIKNSYFPLGIIYSSKKDKILDLFSSFHLPLEINKQIYLNNLCISNYKMYEINDQLSKEEGDDSLFFLYNRINLFIFINSSLSNVTTSFSLFYFQNLDINGFLEFSNSQFINITANYNFNLKFFKNIFLTKINMCYLYLKNDIIFASQIRQMDIENVGIQDAYSKRLIVFEYSDCMIYCLNLERIIGELLIYFHEGSVISMKNSTLQKVLLSKDLMFAERIQLIELNFIILKEIFTDSIIFNLFHSNVLIMIDCSLAQSKFEILFLLDDVKYALHKRTLVIKNILRITWQYGVLCNHIIMEESEINMNFFSEGFTYNFAQSINFHLKKTVIINNMMITSCFFM